MELFDSLIEGVGSFWTRLGEPMFGHSEPAFKFSLTAAQKVTATKAGIAFAGALGVAAGSYLISKAWTASHSFRKEIEAVVVSDLQPEIKKIKETITNPIHLLGRIKMVFNRHIVPLVAGIFSLAGSAYAFTRFDKLLKAIR